MSVPPKSTFLVHDCESVSVALSWTDRTLCYVLWTISPRIPQLSYSMPVQKQSIKTEQKQNRTYVFVDFDDSNLYLPVDTNVVTSFIDDGDCEGVTVPDLKRWTRELTVHGNALVSSAQPLHWSRLDLSHCQRENTHKNRRLNLN